MMRFTAPSQQKRDFVLATLLAALFALLPHLANANPHPSVQPMVRHHLVHHHLSHHRRVHVVVAPPTHSLLPPVSHAKQFKAHAVASAYVRHLPFAAHHYAQAVLHTRPQHQMVRHTLVRDPLARHLAPNAPPVDFGSTVTAALLHSLTTYRLQVCQLRPTSGRAPPVLL